MEDIRNYFESEEMDIEMENYEQLENSENENSVSQKKEDSFEENDEEPENNGECIIKYNPLDFQLDKIIHILKE